MRDMDAVWNGHRGLSEGSGIPVRTCRTLVKNGVLDGTWAQNYHFFPGKSLEGTAKTHGAACSEERRSGMSK